MKLQWIFFSSPCLFATFDISYSLVPALSLEVVMFVPGWNVKILTVSEHIGSTLGCRKC